ncbi:MAG TPA: site-2 protease family protein [Kiloniellales bacterium]
MLYEVSTWVLPVLFAITLHEASHGYVAWRLGDDTAYRMGRVTFNPLRHVDPFGTVILPAMLFMTGGILFGWAKPVPVNFRRLNRPRRDMVLVAAAGPASNLVLATVSALGFHLIPFASATLGTWLADALGKSILINLVLAVLNMLPLPPLDGGRVAVGLLPRALAEPLARLERWGLLILIGGLFLLPILGRQIGVDLDLFHWLIWLPVSLLWPIFAALAGIELG